MEGEFNVRDLFTLGYGTDELLVGITIDIILLNEGQRMDLKVREAWAQ